MSFQHVTSGKKYLHDMLRKKFMLYLVLLQVLKKKKATQNWKRRSKRVDKHCKKREKNRPERVSFEWFELSTSMLYFTKKKRNAKA